MTRALTLRIHRFRLAVLLLGGVLGFRFSPRGMSGKIKGLAL